MDGLRKDRRLRSATAADEAPGAVAEPPAAAPPEGLDDDGERLAWLVRTIQSEIIPRLVLAHGEAEAGRLPCAANAPRLGPGPTEIDQLAALAIGSDPEAAAAFIDALRLDGLPLDAVYLEVIAPAARTLGHLWETDECDFTQVTLGLWRLQRIVHTLSPVFQAAAAAGPAGRRALLAAVPGSQHSIGVLMVREFFRRAGWEVGGDSCESAEQILHAVHTEWYDVAGFSIGSETHVERLARLIEGLRRVSLNPRIGVLVGGSILASLPELVPLVRADATAKDAPNALRAAQSLIAMRERCC